MIMAKLGIKNLNDMIGRVDLLELDNAINHWKKDGIDLSNLLTPAEKYLKILMYLKLKIKITI